MISSRARLALTAAAAMVLVVQPPGAGAQQSRVMPLKEVKNILELTNNSWIAFRDFNGRQLIYFSHIISWRCGVKELRYSLNGKALDRTFPLPDCDQLNPNSVKTDNIYLSEKLNSVSTIAVQLLFDDGTESDIHIYQPCPGGSTCAQRTETIPAGSQ